MVVAILKSLLLKELRPLIDRLNIGQAYYITDSPVSKYHNKLIFYIISNHQLIFGMPAVWNYFEKGHGKGPCDGVGGAVKAWCNTGSQTRRPDGRCLPVSQLGHAEGEWHPVLLHQSDGE